MGHTATFDPIVRCIYVYGGSKNLKWFRDIYTLDLDNWKWQLMKVYTKQGSWLQDNPDNKDFEELLV